MKIIKKVKFSQDVNNLLIARMMMNTSRKDCVKIIKNAKLLADNNDSCIVMHHFITSYYNVTIGIESENFIVDAAMKRRIAIHEAGHTVANIYQEKQFFIVQYVTIKPRKSIMGFTSPVRIDESKPISVDLCQSEVITSLSGVIAEQICNTSNNEKIIDKDSAYNNFMLHKGNNEELEKIHIFIIAIILMTLDLVKKKKMSSEDISKIDTEASRLLKLYYEQAFDLILDHKDKVQTLAQVLLEKETLLSQQVYDTLNIARPMYDFEVGKRTCSNRKNAV